MAKKIIIIGLGTGGFAAALAIKKTNRQAEIIIVDEKDFDLLHTCGLPFFLENKIKDIKHLKHNLSLEKMGIVQYKKHRAVKIDSRNKRVRIRNLVNTNEYELEYNDLIISTGASPFMPPIPGNNLEGVFSLRDPNKAEEIKKLMKKAKHAVVVGAGAIGLEAAYAFKEKGIKVTVVEMLPYALPKSIDEDTATILHEYLANEKIELMFSKKVEKIEGSNKVTGVIVEGNKIKADIVIMAAGVRPNVKLLKDTGVELEHFNVIVNDKMETNVKDIYAVGDIVQIKSAITGKPTLMQLATSAYKQGTIAGTNAAGGNLKYKGAAGTFVSVVGDIEIASTGLNTQSAKDAGFEIITGKAKGTSLPDWYPGGKALTVKIIVNKEGRILGGQAIGAGAAERINVISTAICSGMNIKDLSNVELAYCPAVSQTYDVLMQAVDLAIRKMK